MRFSISAQRFTASENFSPKGEVVEEPEPPSRTVVTHEYDYDNDYVDESDEDI